MTALLLWCALSATTLDRAREAYDRFALDEALELTAEALLESDDPQWQIQVRALEAEIHLAQGREEAAIADYVAILQIDPSYTGSDMLSPKIVSALSTAREIVRAQQQLEERERQTQVTLTAPPVEVEPRRERRFYQTWWFWTLTGVVVAGGVGLFAYRSAQPNFPEEARGPIDISF